MSTRAPDAIRLLGVQPMPDVSPATVKAAKQAWAEHRSAERYGFKCVPVPLLSPPSSSTKLKKTGEYGLNLAQAELSGYNVCRWSTPECRHHCLGFSGRMARYPDGNLNKAKLAQMAKTTFLVEHPQDFLVLLVHELGKLVDDEVRLNVLSDLPWERIAPWLFNLFPNLHFYDYTKGWMRGEDDDLPANYRLTYSVSEKTRLEDAGVMVALAHQNVAIVGQYRKGGTLPSEVDLGGWLVPVVDGDKSDNRYDDPIGVAVVLRPKGTMRRGSTMVRL